VAARVAAGQEQIMAKDGGYGRLVMKAAKVAAEQAKRQGRPVTTEDINRQKRRIAAEYRAANS
jgi:hypothetical protein